MALKHALGTIVVLTCVVCYHNSCYCGFVFDDISAIKDNRDLRPHTPLANVFLNDFWGTPMHKEQSHKSYRPLCVLTFRWNYLMWQLEPMGYHLVNMLLHSVVCLMYFRYCEIDENGYLILPKDTNFYEKYTTSCVVATSVNLSIWQRVLEEHLGTVMDNVAYDLKDGNRVSATDSRVAKLNGTLMSLRYFIKLNDTLCQPIAGGDQPKLDHFHKRLWIHFSIPRRIKNVEKRLHHCFQTMDLVRVLYSYKKHAFSAILYYILSIITLAYSILSTLFKIRQSRANRLKLAAVDTVEK